MKLQSSSKVIEEHGRLYIPNSNTTIIALIFHLKLHLDILIFKFVPNAVISGMQHFKTNPTASATFPPLTNNPTLSHKVIYFILFPLILLFT